MPEPGQTAYWYFARADDADSFQATFGGRLLKHSALPRGQLRRRRGTGDVLPPACHHRAAGRCDAVDLSVHLAWKSLGLLF
jgi:hypothetical protein